MIIRLLLLCSYAIRPIPLKALLLCGDVAGLFWFYCIPIRRKVVQENIKMAMGQTMTDRQIISLARRNYRHYGRVLVEVLRGASWTKEEYLRKIKYHGMEKLSTLRDSGKAAYILSLHVGNWEVAIGATAASGIPFCIVVKQGQSRLYRMLQEWYRSRQGVMILAESHTANEILKCISSGRTVGFVLDQFMGPPIGLPVQFFGREAGTAVALALLTERRPADVILTYTFRDESGMLNIKFETLPAPSYLSQDLASRLFEKTQFYNDNLERIVRCHPEQWMWLHRRWKSYRGEPRWAAAGLKAVKASFAAVFFLLLLGCSSPPLGTPTGITLPEDKLIEVPQFVRDSAPSTTVSLPVAVNSAQPIELRPTQAPKLSPQTESVTKPLPVVPPQALVVVPVEVRIIPQDRIPFDLGERLEVDISWMALPAGSAVLEVRRGTTFEGRSTFLLWANVLSSRLVDAIYHLDNTLESYVDSEGLIPYKFLLHMFETNQKKETRVLFDHPKAKAFFWSKRLSQRWGDEQIDRTDQLVPYARDMFSALYYSRLLDYRLGEVQRFPVFENGQNWDVEVNPIANEMVRSPAGAFQCWKVMVTVKLRNVLTQTGDIAMWLSDDSKRYLVRFDAKVKIGSLVGSLVKIREKL